MDFILIGSFGFAFCKGAQFYLNKIILTNDFYFTEEAKIYNSDNLESFDKFNKFKPSKIYLRTKI